jgi:serine/threonine protein kinase
MEFCERGSLYHVLRNCECPIGWERALDMLKQIVKGIAVLHNHKPAIMHRDLKV